MIIINVNEGTKIPVVQTGTRLTFDDDLSLNLSKREQDWPVHIDVCYNEDMELVVGAAVGRSYVAQVDIPSRRYQAPVDNGMNAEENPPVPIPLDMNTVTLSLWSIDDLVPAEGVNENE